MNNKINKYINNKDFNKLESFQKNKTMLKKRNMRYSNFANIVANEIPIEAVASPIIPVPSISMSTVNEMPSGGGNVLVQARPNPNAIIHQLPNASARFNLVINRLTSGIPYALPVPLFGSLDYESDWTEVIEQYLPAGVTYTVAPSADKKSLEFTFTDGVSIDIIRVSVREKSYRSLLRGSQNSLIQLSQIKAKISDAANESQFTQNFITYTNTLFGRVDNDKFTPDDYLRDDQYVQTMRTINQNINLDPEKTLIVLMENLANNQLTLTTTVSMFETKRAIN